MFKRILSLGTIALLSATAFGRQSTGGEFQTVTVQGGQGSPIALSVPVVPQEAEIPYALTGQDSTPHDLQWHTTQFGQGGLIWIAE